MDKLRIKDEKKVDKIKSKADAGKIKQESEEITKKETQIEESELKKRYEKELCWVFGVIIGIFVLIGIFYFLNYNANNFYFEGLAFTKERFDKLVIYHHFYEFIYGGERYRYNLYLRVDPRKNRVNVDGEIEFNGDDLTYISVNGEGLTQCPESSAALASLASFLSNNFIKIKGATSVKEEAEINNLTYATCDLYPSNTVISFFSGNETKITREGNCYKVSIFNCEILEASEKFQTQAIIDGVRRRQSLNSAIKSNVK